MEKYTLTKKFQIEEELKIYFMAVIANPMIPVSAGAIVKTVGIVSYNYQTALNKAREIYATPINGAIQSSESDFSTVNEIISAVDIQGMVANNIVPKEEKPKIMAIKNFKTSLMLAADEYVKDKKKSLALKKIIETI